MNFLKPTVFMVTAITAFAAVAATTNTDVVIMKNATYCHLLSTGGHVLGSASFIDTYLEGGERGGDQYRFSSIDPGSTGKTPLIKKNGRQYILIDRGDASDVCI
jgi:hypothetical protein